MAGDWIKMRSNLWDDPRVAKLCDLTGRGEAAIVGALYWLWATADQHTEDGFLPGLTLRQIDRKTGVAGFGAGLVAIGWLADEAEGVRILGFDQHNGASAKKRCQTAKRVAAFKSGNAQETQDEDEGNAASVTKALAQRDLEKEKRREDIDQSTQAAGEQHAEALRAQFQAEGHEPTPAARATLAMKRAGMQAVNPGDPRLLALVEQGATEEEFHGAAAEAVSKGKGFAWALGALQGKRRDAAAITLAAAPARPVNTQAEETARLLALDRAREEQFKSPEGRKAVADALAEVKKRLTGATA